MKRFTFYLAALAVVLLSASAFAQQSASSSASATAKIKKGIKIVKTQDLNFGTIVLSGNDGDVTVTADASGAWSATGGLTRYGSQGTDPVTEATFDVTANDNSTYTITGQPSGPITLTEPNSNATMSCTLTYSDPAPPPNTLYVGGVLSVSATQEPGTYSSAAGAITITVTYQ